MLVGLSVAPAGAAWAEYRSYDGSGNNVANPAWGAAATALLRIAPAAYPGDGSGSTIVSSPDRANPRAVSNAVFAQTGTMPNSRGMTAGVWQWGQFLDHDVDLTATNPAEPASVFAPANDPYGLTMIPFSRSASVADPSGVRQQINSITSYIDASNVYGSDAERAGALREHAGGRLLTSAGGLLLPTNDMSGLGSFFTDSGGLGAPVRFVAGDVRANEQTGLTAMHTLFVREHNRLADLLADSHAGDASWDDERIYQTARSIVGAEVQAITYNEFLPALLGPYAPRAADYQYNPSVNAAITTEFSTAFFRLGHSLLNEQLLLTDMQGNVLGGLSLRESFFQPQQILDNPAVVDKVLRGLMAQQANELDAHIIDDVRNFLFAPQGGVGSDLASLNIQRGRDHGLPDYNTLRVAYGLGAVSSFADITSDATLQSALAQLYGSIDNIDAWVGALAEDHLPGASTGALITAAMVEQFTRLRDGDRFFYTGDPSLWTSEAAQLVDLGSLTLNDLLVWNTAMEYADMPPSFFLVAVPEPAGALVAASALVLSVRRRV